MSDFLILLVIVFGIVDLAVVGVLGIMAIVRLMPRKVAVGGAGDKPKKEAKAEDKTAEERSQVGKIQE